MQRRLFLFLCVTALVGLSVFKYYAPVITLISTFDSVVRDQYLGNSSVIENIGLTSPRLAISRNEPDVSPESLIELSTSSSLDLSQSFAIDYISNHITSTPKELTMSRNLDFSMSEDLEVINTFNYIALSPSSTSEITSLHTIDRTASSLFENSNINRAESSAMDLNVTSAKEEHKTSSADLTAPSSTPTATEPTTSGLSKTTEKPTLYLTTKFHERLGNQMFMYAALIGLARAQHREPFVDWGANLMDTFQITYIRTDISTSGWDKLKESHYATFDSKFMKLPPKNLIVAGYLQSWRYFEHSQDEIRREYTIKPSIRWEVESLLLDYRSRLENHVLVGVHIRRGDFAREDKQRVGYGVAKASYFVKAFAKMRSLNPNQNLTFLVASDDLVWCKNNLNDSGVLILPESSAGKHFAILSSSDHVILTGGTFGWWIAWLANGITIYYKNYVKNNTSLHNGFSEHDYYPTGWIGLDD